MIVSSIIPNIIEFNIKFLFIKMQIKINIIETALEINFNLNLLFLFIIGFFLVSAGAYINIKTEEIIIMNILLLRK